MNNVKFNNFERQWSDIHQTAHESFSGFGNSGWYILGSKVKEFELALAKTWRLPYAVSCGNGMDALEISLRCQSKKKLKVLTTPLSAFATTLAAAKVGAEVVFCDVDEQGNIDLDLAESIFELQQIDVFMPVHLFGFSLNLERLKELRSKYNFILIEDCAQSILSTWNGLPAGSAGDFCCTSFYPTKNLGCMGDGGAVLMNDEDMYIEAQKIRDYGQSEKYVHEVLGMNSRLDELQAALLVDVFLPRLEAATVRRRTIATAYQKGIVNEHIKLVPWYKEQGPAFHLFPILVPERNSFIRFLTSKKIETGIHYPRLISEQPAMSGINFQVVDDLTRAKTFASCEVSLPINPYLTDDEVDYVIKSCNSWCP